MVLWKCYKNCPGTANGGSNGGPGQTISDMVCTMVEEREKIWLCLELRTLS